MNFVSKEISDQLKHKNFNDPCFAYYENGSNTLNYYYSNIYEDVLCHNESNTTNVPTIEQTLKWLREFHNIHIEMNYCHSDLWGWTAFHCDIEDRIDDYIDNDSLFNSYEEAAINGIKYILDNII